MMCAAGGAKDTVSFNVRLSDEQLPALSSITHEGLFYQHYFDVGQEDEALFSCDWSFAASKDPLSGKMEHYVGCGMRSKLDGDGIRRHGRPPVQLSIVLDISGSMSSPFRSNEKKNKLDVAKECIINLLNNLRPDDALGLVGFDDKLEFVQPMTCVADLDVGAFTEQLLAQRPRNSTEMVLGMSGGLQLLTDFAPKAPAGPALKRIMFLTDAKPSAGPSEAEPLLEMTESQAKSGVFVSFVGLGVDFGVELIDRIARIKGCNYFTVESGPAFARLMAEDFDYMVTPFCFNVSIKLAPATTSTVRVQRVYGSPGCESAENGKLFVMSSGQPSNKDEHGHTKGAMILVKLDQPPPSAPRQARLELDIGYDDIDGKHYAFTNTLDIEFAASDNAPEHYSNEAIRKAIVLTRYVNALRWWIVEHSAPAADSNAKTNAKTQGVARYVNAVREWIGPRETTKGPAISASTGIPPAPVAAAAAETSHYARMWVSPHYKAMFASLIDYIEREAEKLADAGHDEAHRLPELTRHLVSLKRFVSGEEIQRVLPGLTTDDEVATAKLTAAQLQERCETALGVDDLSERLKAFETEIKRRLLVTLKARLMAMDKARLQNEGEDQKKALAEATDFLKDRTDQDWDEWQEIAEKEARYLVHGPPPRQRFFVM